MRIALDTNVVVSAVATRGLCADLFRLVLAEHHLLLGETVLTEVERVLRTKFRVPDAVRHEVTDLLRRQAEVVTERARLSIRGLDAADRAVLAEAVAGGADLLVTGDQDLLDVAAGAPIPVLTPRQLWERVRRA